MGCGASSSKYQVRSLHGWQSKYVVDMESPPLGTGKFGCVRLGYPKTWSRNQTVPPVALKFIFKKGLSDAQRAFLRHTCQRHAKVPPHPHVVRQLDVFEDDDHLIVVQEAMLGGDLMDRLLFDAADGAGKQFSERKAARCLKQICEAVAHLHSHGIAHRALAPESIMCLNDSPQSPVKLNNFSLSNLNSEFGKTLDSHIMCSQCGMPGFTAPEVLQGNSYGHGCDMWAVGVLMYIMLTGELPYKSDAEVLMKPAPKFTPKQNVSKYGVDMLAGLLRKSTKLRVSAGQAAVHVWIRKASEYCSDKPRNKDCFQALQAIQAERREASTAMSMACAIARSNRASRADDGDHQVVRLEQLVPGDVPSGAAAAARQNQRNGGGGGGDGGGGKAAKSKRAGAGNAGGGGQSTEDGGFSGELFDHAAAGGAPAVVRAVHNRDKISTESVLSFEVIVGRTGSGVTSSLGVSTGKKNPWELRLSADADLLNKVKVLIPLVDSDHGVERGEIEKGGRAHRVTPGWAHRPWASVNQTNQVMAKGRKSILAAFERYRASCNPKATDMLNGLVFQISVCYPSKNTFEGDWLYGVKEGYGVYTWPSGDVYRGQYFRGERTGLGQYVQVIEGSTSSDAGGGEGKGGKKGKPTTVKTKHERRYLGDLRGGERHGGGHLKLEDGTEYVGWFNDGKYHGAGQLTMANGQQWRGTFDNNAVVQDYAFDCDIEEARSRSSKALEAVRMADAASEKAKILKRDGFQEPDQ